MGRDISVISTHPACEAAQIRSIIDAANQVDPDSGTVSFAIRPEKLHLFSK